MSTKLFIWAAVGFIFLGFVALIYLFVTNPQKVEIDTVHLREANSDRGAYIFLATGCSNCHVAEGETEKTRLAGGQKFKTDFGVFIAPNISNSKEYGIGGWKFNDFYTAIKFGPAPPSFSRPRPTSVALPPGLQSTRRLCAAASTRRSRAPGEGPGREVMRSLKPSRQFGKKGFGRAG